VPPEGSTPLILDDFLTNESNSFVSETLQLNNSSSYKDLIVKYIPRKISSLLGKLKYFHMLFEVL